MKKKMKKMKKILLIIIATLATAEVSAGLWLRLTNIKSHID